MATAVVENVGKKTLTELDYVGSLNIQLWATLRAMINVLPSCRSMRCPRLPKRLGKEGD